MVVKVIDLAHAEFRRAFLSQVGVDRPDLSVEAEQQANHLAARVAGADHAYTLAGQSPAQAQHSWPRPTVRRP